jgi:hypothetical protein
MILKHYQANSNMDLVYSLRHLSKVQLMGDKDKHKCLATRLEVESLQKTPIPEDNRAEMLLELMRHSSDMALEVSLYRQSLYQNGGKHDYQRLLEIFRRTIVMEREEHNDKALTQGLTSQGLKPTKPANPVTTPCKYGDACNVAGCQFKHPSPSKGQGTGKSPSNPKGGKQPGGKTPGGKQPNPKGQGAGKSPPNPKGGDKKKGGDKQTPCYRWNLGACPLPEGECKYAHRAVKGDEKDAFDKYKAGLAVAKAKAKAKAKANPS